MQHSKKNNSSKARTSIIGCLLFITVFSNLLLPIHVSAAVDPIRDYTEFSNNSNLFTSGEQNVGTAATSLLESAGTCSVGAILGRLISSTIGRAIQTLTSYLTGFITSYFTDLLKAKVKTVVAEPTVPVADSHVLIETTKAKEELRQLTAKETGQAGQDTDSLISGFIKGLSNISLDSIMFCVINEIMNYITKSTIKWINSGFDGNPVFVQNPTALFQSVADRETSNFLKELSGGQGMVANGVSNIIIGIADPLRDSVVNSIIGSSNETFANRVSPTMNQNLLNNYNSYVSGQQWPGFQGFMQISRPENNYYGLTMMAHQENSRRIAAEQYNQQLQLQYANGYKSKTQCPPGKTRSDGTCYPEYTKAVVAGSQIKDELQSRGMMKYMRVSFANDFDSIITALVNQLIKIAVTEVFEEINE